MSAPVSLHPSGLRSLWDMLKVKGSDLLASASHVVLLADRFAIMGEEAKQPWIEFHARFADSLKIAVEHLRQVAQDLDMDAAVV